MPEVSTSPSPVVATISALPAERGAVALHPDGGYLVRGTEQIYRVRLKPDRCGCLGFGMHGHCYHVHSVKRFLRERLPCIACDGWAESSLEYFDGRGYLLRIICQAEGCGFTRVL